MQQSGPRTPRDARVCILRGLLKTDGTVTLQSDIRKVIGAMGDVVIWRNHTAAFEVDGRFQKSGLAKGGADLIGIVTRYLGIYPDIVGVFLALEVKEGRGRLSKEQRMFLTLVNSMGGVGAEVRSVEEAIYAVNVARGKAERSALTDGGNRHDARVVRTGLEGPGLPQNTRARPIACRKNPPRKPAPR